MASHHLQCSPGAVGLKHCYAGDKLVRDWGTTTSGRATSCSPNIRSQEEQQKSPGHAEPLLIPRGPLEEPLSSTSMCV